MPTLSTITLVRFVLRAHVVALRAMADTIEAILGHLEDPTPPPQPPPPPPQTT